MGIEDALSSYNIERDTALNCAAESYGTFHSMQIWMYSALLAKRRQRQVQEGIIRINWTVDI